MSFLSIAFTSFSKSTNVDEVNKVFSLSLFFFFGFGYSFAYVGGIEYWSVVVPIIASLP